MLTIWLLLVTVALTVTTKVRVRLWLGFRLPRFHPIILPGVVSVKIAPLSDAASKVVLVGTVSVMKVVVAVTVPVFWASRV